MIWLVSVDGSRAVAGVGVVFVVDFLGCGMLDIGADFLVWFVEGTWSLTVVFFDRFAGGLFPLFTGGVGVGVVFNLGSSACCCDLASSPVILHDADLFLFRVGSWFASRGAMFTVAFIAEAYVPGVRGGCCGGIGEGRSVRGCEATIIFSVVSYGVRLKTCFPNESWAVRARHFFWWAVRTFLLTKSSLQFWHCSVCLFVVLCLSGVCVMKSTYSRFFVLRWDDRNRVSPVSCPLAISGY